MAKKFDLKQFLLARGERVGLWVAVGLMAVLVVFNLFLPGKGLFSGSPSANANDIKKKADDGRNRIRSARPAEGSLEIPPEIAQAGVEFTAVNPEPFRPVADLFLPGQVGNDKRSMPTILTPREFGFGVALAQIRSYLLKGDTIAVLEGLGGPEGGSTGTAAAAMSGMFNGPRGAPRGGSGAGGLPRGGSGGGAPRGGPAAMMAPGGFNPQANGPQMPGAAESGGKEGKINYVTMDELEKALAKGDIRLAETLVPQRIAVVTASFPYRQQCEEFRAALKLPSLADLLHDEKLAPRFVGFEVKRCEVLAGGKTTNWEALDLKKDFTPIMVHTGRRQEPDDPKLEPVIMGGLVMPRPIQFQSGQYPKVEMLPGIVKTLADLEKAAAAGQILPPANRQFSKDDLDIFNPKGGEAGGAAEGPSGRPPLGPMPGTGAGRPPMAAPGVGAPSPGGEVAEEAVPEYILVRFLDVTVKPGKTYQYQIQIRMANPNFGEKDKVAFQSIANDPELRSPFVTATGSVTVPYGFNYYAVDEKELEKQNKELAKKDRRYLTEGRDITGDKDVAAMQLHNWMEQYFVPPDYKVKFPVGEWTLADRLLVYRGEYLARKASTELPLWMTQRDQFVLAANPKNRRQKTVEVYMGEGSGPELGPREPVIVDFEGGKVSYDRIVAKGADDKTQTARVLDKAPVEVLVLAANGNLVVRNSLADSEDPERETRRKTILKRLEDLKSEKKKGPGPGGGDPLFDPKKPGGG